MNTFNDNKKRPMGAMYVNAGLGLIILAAYVFILINMSSVMPELEKILNSRSIGRKAAQGRFFIVGMPVASAGLLIWPLLLDTLSFRLGLIHEPRIPNFIYYCLGYIVFCNDYLAGSPLKSHFKKEFLTERRIK